MQLSQLKPKWYGRVDDNHFERVGRISKADGIIFLCPKCLTANGMSAKGVHSIVCWQPHVPQSTPPTPGRWQFRGTGFKDLTLVAGSSSILLTSGCAWHGFITNGQVTNA